MTLPGYYINCDASIDRRDFMEARAEMLAMHGTDLKRFRASTQDELEPFKSWFSGRFLTCPWLSRQRGTKACAVSHIRLWHHILANYREPVLVLEDDVEPAPNIAEYWDKWKDELPSDFGIAFLSLWDSNTNKKFHSANWTRIINAGSEGGGCHTYIINPQMLPALLDAILPLYQEIDKSTKSLHAAIPLFASVSQEASNWQTKFSKDSVRRA